LLYTAATTQTGRTFPGWKKAGCLSLEAAVPPSVNPLLQLAGLPSSQCPSASAGNARISERSRSFRKRSSASEPDRAGALPARLVVGSSAVLRVRFVAAGIVPARIMLESNLRRVGGEAYRPGLGVA